VKSCAKQLSGRSRKRWEDNIKMNIKEIYSEVRRLTEQVQDHVQWLAFALTM
jgi:DNA-binding transcriptional regulator PaaX